MSHFRHVGAPHVTASGDTVVYKDHLIFFVFHLKKFFIKKSKMYFSANKLNVTSLKKLVFFDQEGVAGLPDNNKDAGSAEVEEVVTMPAYEEYNFLESEAELDPHFNYEFVNSAIKDEIDAPEVALPEPEVPVEKIEKKVVKVPKVVPVVPVVTPVAKMERKRSREHPTPEEPKKGKEIGEKQNEEKQEDTVKQSHSAPAVSPVNIAPVKQPVPMSWASIAKKRNQNEAEKVAQKMAPIQKVEDEMEQKMEPGEQFDPMAKRISEIICQQTNDVLSPGKYFWLANIFF